MSMILKTPFLALMLLALTFSSNVMPAMAAMCPYDSSLDCGSAVPPHVANPDSGRSWSPSEDNEGGRALRGGMTCQDKFPHCTGCSPDLRRCNGCVNGFELDNGQCVQICEISKCQECHPGGNTCKVCMDETHIGGYAYDLYKGGCALTVPFDDLEAPTQDDNYEAQVPDGYHGFEWDEIWYIDGSAAQTDTGYDLIAASKPYSAFNAYANPASFTSADGSTFSLKSIQMTPAWRENLEVKIEGFDSSGALLGEKTVTLSSPSVTEAIEFGPDFRALTSVTISSSGGTDPNGTGNHGEHVVFDDIIVMVKEE